MLNFVQENLQIKKPNPIKKNQKNFMTILKIGPLKMILNILTLKIQKVGFKNS